MGNGPLRGVRIIDLTRVLAGPYGTMILGDLGADIIRIEDPNAPDETRKMPPFINGQSHYHLSINRNKRGIALNLKHDKGKELFFKLIENADAVIENFRPGVMEKLGFSYETLSSINSRLIMCSISGFGQYGPLRDKVSFDIVTQAMSGAMSVNGEPGQKPVKLGIPMGDLIGGFYGAIGVLSAVVERGKTGKGKYIDVSLMDGMVSLLGYLAGIYFATGKSPTPVGTAHHNIVPYGAFEVKDGYLIIACLLESFWGKLCKAIGKEEVADLPEFRTNIDRVKNREQVNALVQNALLNKTLSEWCEILELYDVPHAPILKIGDALSHENTIARKMVTKVRHETYGEVPIIGRPIQFDREVDDDYLPPPLHGEHTREILNKELGISFEDIDQLDQMGVIKTI